MIFYIISPKKEKKNFTLENFKKITQTIKVNFFQLRPKYSTKNENIAFNKKYFFLFSDFCKKKKIKLIVNDDVELAQKLNFDGVHLGQEDIDCSIARRILGEKSIIGISCNDSLKLAQKAQNCGANYLAFGPVFNSVTKKSDRKFVNLKNLKTIEKKISVPYTLIGGIKHENITMLKNLNFKNLAVIDSLWNFKKGPVESAKLYSHILKKG